MELEHLGLDEILKMAEDCDPMREKCLDPLYGDAVTLAALVYELVRRIREEY